MDLWSPRAGVRKLKQEWLLYHLADQRFRFMWDAPRQGECVALDCETTGLNVRTDEIISMAGEPGHDALCAREQDFLYRAITEDIDLDRHMDDAVTSLRICLAADESVRTGQPVKL